MNRIAEKLDKINTAWNDYFLEYQFFQNAISFKEETKTNYFGDIIQYLNDSFELVTDRHFKSRPDNQLFNTIGLLQVIYVQQDLTDELLAVFGLAKSATADKEPNRKLRNELIGHPIRREKAGNALISSVFLRFDDPRYINYVLYSRENNFKPVIASHVIEEIIEGHIQFLDKYFDQIIAKIKRIFSKYLKKLEQVEKMANSKAPFENLVVCVGYFFETIFSVRHIFLPENLLHYYSVRDTHPRYLHAVSLFVTYIKGFIKGERVVIGEWLNPQPTIDHLVEFKVTVTDIDEDERDVTEPDVLIVDVPDNQGDRHLSYELSKLRERKHPKYSVDYFLRKFSDRQNILQELINMKDNETSDLEYYASLEFLVYLIEQGE